MSAPSVHDDWLSLIEISGPFLAVPVLKEAFPQGLEELDATKRKRLRQAYEEWREALELEDAQFAELHVAWIDEVLSRGLELDEDGKGDVLKRADWCIANLQANLPEHGVTLSPALAVVDEQRSNKPLLLIQTYAQDVDLDTTLKQDGWAATPADRMVQLCRSLGCRLGLVTNGERWMLVDAPVGAVTTFASWYARIWSQEPITLQAFVHLLGIRRFFVDETEQLPALFDRSLKFQDEVTDALGEQVRRAVEVLIQTLDKADQDRNRELLHDVKEPELYEAALTVMMRLVFLLSAEERGLLLMGDERYEANYALSTLRMQLRKESEEILERRWDAWSRLLAIFRAVFGGIEHENLRLPALGGSLFDPDRFPFLEGRTKGSNWRINAAKPLPIDNRTVLLLLEAIQQFQGRTLSYRALDVEQIGYVYEGLLERTVKRTDEVTLELDATKSAKTPWIKLAELDSARLDGAVRLAELLQERSGSSASRVRNDLAKPVDDTLVDRLLTACQGDTKLRDRVKPYAHLLRTDPWGYPLVYPAGAFIVTTGSDRRETGTHYTPKSLTEAIVAETLTSVAYVGPAEGTPREQWALKSPAELLDLKICDPAMGSGAFLVQACRWLSDRLVEAWSQVEAMGKTVSVDGEVLEAGVAKEPLPRDSEARTVIARRLIAERCLYGVDLNPLAVELAKLSIWLVTLAKGRPFGFLDHNLRCGDSLLGIHRLNQLTELSMMPTGKGQQRLFGQNIERAVQEAIMLRQQLRAMPIRDIHDVEAMAQLDASARQKLEIAERIADALIGEVLAAVGNGYALENGLSSLAIHAGQAISGDEAAFRTIAIRASARLAFDLPEGKPIRKPFHWPLEFPEVFSGINWGFDAFIGNPPFAFGKNVSTSCGTSYNSFLVLTNPAATKNVDICSHFFHCAFTLLNSNGALGMLATSSIAEGETRLAALESISSAGGCIFSATSKSKWPGAANVFICRVSLSKRKWEGAFILDGKYVNGISSFLTPDTNWQPVSLLENQGVAFYGAIPNGDGFFISRAEAESLLTKSPDHYKVLYPFLTGKDLNSNPSQSASRFAINFWDWNEDVASKYSDAFQIVADRVKPYRATLQNTKPKLAAKWWIYEANPKGLHDAIGRSENFRGGATKTALKEVLVIARVSSTNAFTFVNPNQVFDCALIVIASDDFGIFAVLQSSIHFAFAWQHGGKMKSDLRYSPTMCLATFPFPKPDDFERLRFAGRSFNERRKSILTKRDWGLTRLSNALHDSDCNDSDIQGLRSCIADLDMCVLDAYGWSDIELNHGFHHVDYLPAGRNLRYTISEPARIEILHRLADLNLQRHKEEAAQSSLASDSARGGKKPERKGRRTSSVPISDLFDGANA
ncbi:type IIL restriction-modification enzyme MmeI [Rhodoferax sp.]|uniref:Eco57I restriction-modification methylase domain-containing protein n=1 Tax=Rhodoferax sp. TaxID=50421 RepID=UPI0025F0C119|nr:type IIL restriction-modification enzyme MmeI [Rhodoferax sp.]